DHRKSHKNPKWPVQHWIAKHGPKNIQMTVLEEVSDPAELNEAEIRWIEHYGTFCDWNKGGVNMTPGGFSAGWSLSARERLRQANSGEQSWTKFTWDDIRFLRDDYPRSNKTYKDYAREYGVGITAVSNVIQNITWIDETYTPPTGLNKPPSRTGE